MLSAKLYFLEIALVHQKLLSVKCAMLKTLNSNFLDCKDTLNCLETVQAIMPLILSCPAALPTVTNSIIAEHFCFRNGPLGVSFGQGDWGRVLTVVVYFTFVKPASL